MTPSSGKVGTTAIINITASTFSLEGDYEIRWSPAATFEENKTIVLSKGNVPRGNNSVTARFTVPEAKYGINFVQFMRTSYNDPVNFQFNVRPNIEVTPSSTRSGNSVTISGTGFPARDRGTLTFDGKMTNVKIATNDMGSFTAKFKVPDTTPGEHKLIVKTLRLYTEAASTNLKVLPNTSPEPEPPKVENNDTTTKGNSNDKTTVNLPLNSKYPPRPAPVTPMGHMYGLFGAQPVTFSWKKVSDPTGIIYTLEIADNVNFSSIKPNMKKTGLTQTNYTISMEPGTYYWRVKAINGEGTEGQWSCAPYAFKVGELSILIHEFMEFLRTIVPLDN